MKKNLTSLIMLFTALFTMQFTGASAQGDSSKKDPRLSFDKESLEYIIGSGETFVEPVLNNPDNVPVYYVSDNNSAATVDYSTGKVTFITKGIVKISAISNETDVFNPAQASYTINVIDNSIIFEASFIDNDCGFTEEEGVPSVWEHESDGYMKADAYGKVSQSTMFYLRSPEFTLARGKNTVSFGECGSYFGNRWSKEAQLVIAEADNFNGEWTVLDRQYPVGDQNVVKNTGDIEIPSKFRGKKVIMAFRYTSDGNKNSGIWHIRNLHVKGSASGKADAGLAFEKEKVDYIIDSDELFTAPKLINPNNLEVTYSSSNTAAATVDAQTGAVTICAEGVAVITAESAETDEYSAGKASYEINIYSSTDAQYAEPALRSPVVAVEFTGQRCRYCPNMGKDLQLYQERHGKENFIITALHHLKDYSLLPEKYISLYNEEALKYAESLEIHQGLPQLAYNSLGPGRTDLTVDQMFKEDDLLECKGNVTFNDNKEYIIDISTRLRSNQKEALKGKQVDIILWTLENNIKALQDDNGKFVYDWNHNHIFRGSMNTTWGEPYEVGTEYKNTLKAPESVIDISNTDVVVFFIDHDSRMILDAATFEAAPDSTSGIFNVNAEDEDSAVYNLMGMKVRHTVKGEIYIKNGKKFIAR